MKWWKMGQIERNSEGKGNNAMVETPNG